MRTAAGLRPYAPGVLDWKLVDAVGDDAISSKELLDQPLLGRWRRAGRPERA
jgi:hypothetical protein